ncbi:hypothetical protein Taro_029917 [Colocasia esculenta]|uniref:Uncharacterized protein n=1 Tax=Colocasia esculenta TaxID=4460 RepID=A0A843VK54_COLES|nr:hypothetical protein [Colocasia esculenta]
MAPSRCCGQCMRMWVALVVLCAVASHAASRSISRLDPVLEEKFMAERHEGWMARHGRIYKDEAEKRHRLAIFKRNVEYIDSFNKAQGLQYRLDINKFADLTEEEFRATFLGFRSIPNAEARQTWARTFRYANITGQDVPPEKDWRQEGAVTDVKDQKQCGCCWAFSTVAAVEGITQIKVGKLVSLSEQELVDCDDGDNGCEGGDIRKAFDFIVKNGGLATEDAYPYQGVDGTCDSKASASRQSPITSFERVRQNDEQALMRAVAQQPISVAIDATKLQHYRDGVFTGPCGTELNHAVTIVGYGTTEEGTKYWMVKNSWGKSWGEAGYVKMQREIEDKQGICGISYKRTHTKKVLRTRKPSCTSPATNIRPHGCMCVVVSKCCKYVYA